jgi:hypothetical protein
MLSRKPIAFAMRLSLALIGMTLAACQTTGFSEKTTIDTLAFCDVARPIWWSKKDTLKTIEQIKVHNAIGKACGWGK